MIDVLDFIFLFVCGGAAIGSLVALCAGLVGCIIGAPFGDSGSLSVIFCLVALGPAWVLGGLWFWNGIRD